MVLSDNDIREYMYNEEAEIAIHDLAVGAIQPASVDLRLAGEYLTPRIPPNTCIDPTTGKLEVIGGDSEKVYTPERPIDLKLTLPVVIDPGGFILGSTIERVSISNGLVGRVEGKSTLGRLGLIIHSSAGYIDPGFEGTITLEMTNIGVIPILLTEGMWICQVSFQTLITPASLGYMGKYQNQSGPTGAKI